VDILSSGKPTFTDQFSMWFARPSAEHAGGGGTNNRHASTFTVAFLRETGYQREAALSVSQLFDWMSVFGLQGWV